jgi:hypothetical protein
MSKPLLLSLGSGKVQELVGTATSQVPVWDNTLSEWQAAAVPGGGGGGGVTSVGLTGGTSGLVIGGDSSPITSTGTFQLNSPQRFQFDTSADFAPTAVGQLSWNAAEGSLNTLMVGGNVDAIVGQQLYQRAVNGDTVTLTKGMVVYVYGSSGTRVQVKRALANADLTSATILGVVAESISVSQEGFIITAGKLGNLSVLPSTTFADGDVVYLSASTPGGLTPTRPTAPQHGVMVGYCVKASNGSAGVLVVHPQNGYELGELHDVLISSPTSGQILVYDATAGQTRWENATPTGSAGVVVTPGAGSLAFSLDAAYAPTFLGLALSGLSASQFVKTDASKNLVSQQFVALGSEVSGTLPAANGGTSFSTYATGDLIYASATNTLAKRTIGSTGDVLTVSAGGVPTWAAPATAGTVTSVSTVTTGMGLTLNVSNPTTTPQLTLAGTLAAAKGGTGIDASASTGVLTFLGGAATVRSIVDGDISASAGIARSKLATGTAYAVLVNGSSGALSEVSGVGTTGQVLTSNGAGAAPTWQAASGGVTSVTASSPLSSSGGSTPDISLGTVPESKGGTNQTTYTTGDLLYASATNTLAKRGIGSSGQVLTVSGGVPTWAAAPVTAAATPLQVSGGTVQFTSQTANTVLAAPNGSSGSPSFRALVAADIPSLPASKITSIPYDIAGEATGTLTVGQVIFHFIAPRALTLSALSQGNTATTVVKIQVAGVDASYPQAVTAGQTVTAVVTTGGTDSWFTITGVVA